MPTVAMAPIRPEGLPRLGCSAVPAPSPGAGIRVPKAAHRVQCRTAEPGDVTGARARHSSSSLIQNERDPVVGHPVCPLLMSRDGAAVRLVPLVVVLLAVVILLAVVVVLAVVLLLVGAPAGWRRNDVLTVLVALMRSHRVD